MTPRPLLALVMIVKNEARGIVETLKTIAPCVDRWTILDTGSTDGTRELIRGALAGIPGELHREPFVDFATSRNRALELHGTSTEFAIMLSGDDLLVDTKRPPSRGEGWRMIGDKPDSLRGFLLDMADRKNQGADAFSIVRVTGTTRYPQTMVVRTDSGWRYEGRTHEVLTKAGESAAAAVIPGVTVIRAVDGTPEEKRERWEKDLEILRSDVDADPANARSQFYLAQTLECLGRYPEALAAYERRIALQGWRDEVYEAAYRRARVMDLIGLPWMVAQQAYLDAYAREPTRAEPLYAIAKHWYDADRTDRAYAVAFPFAFQAALLPAPATRLFVELEIYEWRAADLLAICAFHLGTQIGNPEILAIGERAATKALDARPNDPRLRQNLEFFAAVCPPPR